MSTKEKYYLIHIQYLGFRFHGWAKQPKVKTVHFMIDKTMRFVLNHDLFKTLAASRTDALVSANHAVFELFVKKPLPENFLTEFNRNLPQDIRATKIEEVDKKFNIIQSPKLKEYVYLFSFGEKVHPFCASLMSTFAEDFNLELMKKGAKLFEGSHNFLNYCTQPSPEKELIREIELSVITKNDLYSANFFPDTSYIYRVHGKGFMRNQVRLMMGQLIQLGLGNTSLEQIETSLINPSILPLDYIAPPSGLILNSTSFSEK